MAGLGLWKPIRPEGSLKYWNTPSFDGNLTDHIQNWFIPREGTFHGVDAEMLELLTEMTTVGHMAWVLFPTLLLTEEDQTILML